MQTKIQGLLLFAGQVSSSLNSEKNAFLQTNHEGLADRKAPAYTVPPRYNQGLASPYFL